jgi:hypothetical protein
MDVDHSIDTGISDAVEQTEVNAELAQAAAEITLANATNAYDAAELSAKVDVMIGELANTNASLLSMRGLIEQVLIHNEPDTEPEIIINVDNDDDSGDVDAVTDDTEIEIESEEIESVDSEVTEIEQPDLAPIERPKSRRGLRKNRRR